MVGPSGSGKSTLLQLLARFHDVDAGAVRMGGVDVRAISTDVLMARIAIVFRDVRLFDGTIEENVRLGRPGATDADVRAAASAARLDEVIERLPDGWAAKVGEGGALLSGGERQRVSIARALLKNAPVVLLDEVTSALDPVNEAAVHEGIERLMVSRTVVMVAHRMRTVRRADRVVFLDGGRIVEEGSHDALLRHGGRYADFWNASLTPAARETSPLSVPRHDRGAVPDRSGTAPRSTGPSLRGRRRCPRPGPSRRRRASRCSHGRTAGSARRLVSGGHRALEHDDLAGCSRR